MKCVFGISLLAALFFVGCSPKASDDGAKSSTNEVESVQANPVETIDGVTTVRIDGNDRMQFTLREFTVKAGDTVRIIFENKGKMPKATMGHNVVVLDRDADANAYAGKAAMARDTDFIPASESASVLAHTKLLGPGESDTIEFTAPDPGDYAYICSFPAHCFAGMRGVMTVVAAD